MYSSQPCSAVCGVAEYAPVFYHVQQEAFVQDAEVAYKEEEDSRLMDRARRYRPLCLDRNIYVPRAKILGSHTS